MRRVLEAFSIFKYKIGIDNLRTDKNIVGQINSSKSIAFLKIIY